MHGLVKHAGGTPRSEKTFAALPPPSRRSTEYKSENPLMASLVRPVHSVAKKIMSKRCAEAGRPLLRVKESATVVILRQQVEVYAAPRRLTRRELGVHGTQYDFENRVNTVFGKEQEVEFVSGWEVLMCQRESTNWLRSTPSKTVPMRYPCEYSFPGGTRDEGETIEETAIRELGEELGVLVPAAAIVRLFNVKQTRPVGGTSNIMYNFAMLESENPWLKKLNIEKINGSLLEKETHFAEICKSGAFWGMSDDEKHQVSPEVHKVSWLHLDEAVRIAFTSMDARLVYVDEYQEIEFKRLNIKRRDPLFVTMQTLVHVEPFETCEALIDHCSSMGRFEDEKRAVQYLFSGMTEDEVNTVFEGFDGGKQKRKQKNRIVSMKMLREERRMVHLRNKKPRL